MSLALNPRRRVLLRSMALATALLAAGCMSRVDAPPKSVVFFNNFSADLDTPARGVIAEFAKDAVGAPGRQVAVLGYADSAGSLQANKMLSALRTQVVSDELVRLGVDRARIVQRPRGPTTADPGIESRRVELQLGS